MVSASTTGVLAGSKNSAPISPFRAPPWVGGGRGSPGGGLAGQRRDPVAEQRHARGGEDRLRVELHALDGQLLVPEAHDLALGRPGGDLQAVREALSLDEERVV